MQPRFKLAEREIGVEVSDGSFTRFTIEKPSLGIARLVGKVWLFDELIDHAKAALVDINHHGPCRAD